MAKYVLIAVAALFVIIVAVTGFLMVWDVPAPTARVEKVIPDARFPR
jgi:hypothetical protein